MRIRTLKFVVVIVFCFEAVRYNIANSKIESNSINLVWRKLMEKKWTQEQIVNIIEFYQRRYGLLHNSKKELDRGTSTSDDFNLIYSTYLRNWPVRVDGFMSHDFYSSPEAELTLFDEHFIVLAKISVIMIIVSSWIIFILCNGGDVFEECELYITAIHIEFDALDLVGFIA